MSDPDNYYLEHKSSNCSEGDTLVEQDLFDQAIARYLDAL